MFNLKSLRPISKQNARNIYQWRIGNRDIVGHGCNSKPVYKDDSHFPFPAIRFKENTPIINALREKEMGDWKELSKVEKKALYRASFCQTYSEFQANTGLWKLVLGGVFFLTSFSFWAMIFNHTYVATPYPHTLSEEGRQAQLRAILDLHVNPIDGIASKWDYEKQQWK